MCKEPKKTEPATDIGKLITKSHPGGQPAWYYVGQQQGYRNLCGKLNNCGNLQRYVHPTRFPPLQQRLLTLWQNVTAFADVTFTDKTATQNFEEPLADYSAEADELAQDILAESKKPPKLHPKLTLNANAFDVLCGTVINAAGLGSVQSGAPLLFFTGAAWQPSLKIVHVGAMDLQIGCAATEDFLPMSGFVRIIGRLPPRPIPKLTLPRVTFGTALTAPLLGLAPQIFSALAFEPADLIVQPGQDNLHVIAPAIPGQFEANDAYFTIPVDPRPRTLTISNPTQTLTTGMQLDSALFGPNVDFGSGEGVISFIDPANGLLLAAGDAVPVTLGITGTSCFAAATSKTIQVKVTKGRPVIIWDLTSAAVCGEPVGPSLTATISPATLQDKLKYSLQPTDRWPDRAYCYIRVEFPGDEHFQPVFMEAKQVLVRNATEKQGADEMLNGTAWRRPDLGTPENTALQNWNGDAGGVKALGQKIVKAIANMTYAEVCRYLSAATPAPDGTRKSGGQDMWRWNNGLQVRVKEEGSDHSFGTEVNVEVVTVSGGFTTHVNQTAFKVMINGDAGARDPGKVVRPGGLSDAEWESYKSGAMRVDHIRCPKVPQVITWKLRDNKLTPKRNQVQRDLMTISCLGDAELTFQMNGQNKSREEFATFNFPGPFEYRLVVTAKATERYTGVAASVNVTPE